MAKTEFSFFERQMAMYTTYHRDWRNRLTHFFGVPLIIFSLFVAMALWRFEIAGVPFSFSMVFAAAVFVMWLAMDFTIALALIVLLMPVLVVAEFIALDASTADAWMVFAATFIGGWVLQLWGHVYEGRKPALVKNLFQIFVAPLFLTAEAMVALGLRKGLTERVEACIAEHYPEYARTDRPNAKPA